MTHKGRFKKGQSGNPSGLPRGRPRIYRQKFRELVHLAADDVIKVYHELRQRMLEGESWAYQLYIKDLIPKKSLQEVVQVEQEEGQNRAEAVTSALSGFTELTHDEAIDEIRVLKGLNIKDSDKNTNEDLTGTIEEMTEAVLSNWKKINNKR